MLITRELLPGTLDMLILKALSMGPTHGYGVLLRIEERSRGLLSLEQGSLYPALNRMEDRGLIASEWGTSLNNRRAKFYHLTDAGVRRLEGEAHRWTRMVEAVSNVLDTQPRGDLPNPDPRPRVVPDTFDPLPGEA
ncbi:MAG: PadR family transcriptional regulator [Longimicrobiales bacterium]